MFWLGKSVTISDVNFLHGDIFTQFITIYVTYHWHHKALDHRSFFFAGFVPKVVFGIISLDASNRSKFLLMQSRSFESHSKNVLGLSSHFSVVLSKSILHRTFSSLDRIRVRPRRPPSARPRRSRRNGSQSKKRKRGSRRGGERKDRQSRGSPLLVCHTGEEAGRVGG